jgi:hypothetical protein
LSKEKRGVIISSTGGLLRNRKSGLATGHKYTLFEGYGNKDSTGQRCEVLASFVDSHVPVNDNLQYVLGDTEDSIRLYMQKSGSCSVKIS